MKVAVVTSSTRGIGLECAKTLAKNGFLVYLAVRRLDAAQDIADDIIKNGGNAKVVYFNALEHDTYESFIRDIVEKEGRIDVLVNNYGGTDVKTDFDVINEDFDSFMGILDTNLRSVYVTSKTAIPYMIKNGGGSIINISSIGGNVPDISRTAYGVSKSAINFLTKDIAVQYARENVRCNAVLPGLIATDAAINNMSEEFIKGFLKHVPLNRFGKPEDIANAVLFLAKEESSFITGEIIEVAGGYGKPSPLFGDSIKK